MGSSPEAKEAWQQALGEMRSLGAILGELRSDYPATLELLRGALAGVTERRAALLLLGHLGQDYVLAVADSLVRFSLSHRDALLTRQLLGALPRDDAARVVPTAVWPMLDEAADADAYRRFAELFAHLGLSDSLHELSQRALRDSDPEIREVGEDFASPGGARNE